MKSDVAKAHSYNRNYCLHQWFSLPFPCSIHLHPQCQHEAREGLLEKLEWLVQKMDASLVTRQWKLKLFKACICPWLTWKFSVAEFLLTWFETTIQPLTTLASWQKLSEVTVVFLCFSGHSPPYLSALFKPSSQVHQHETRSSTSKGLLIPHSCMNHGKKSFAFRQRAGMLCHRDWETSRT